MVPDDVVNFRDMATYVGQQLVGLSREIGELAAALDQHEIWHRRNLEQQLRDQANAGPARWQTVAAVLSALASCAAVLIAVVALH